MDTGPGALVVGCAEFGTPCGWEYGCVCGCGCGYGWECEYDGCGVIGAKGGGSRVGTERTSVWARGRFCEMDRWLAGAVAVAVATIPRRERAWTRVGGGREARTDTEGGKRPKRALTGVYLYGITG